MPRGVEELYINRLGSWSMCSEDIRKYSVESTLVPTIWFPFKLNDKCSDIYSVGYNFMNVSLFYDAKVTIYVSSLIAYISFKQSCE